MQSDKDKNLLMIISILTALVCQAFCFNNPLLYKVSVQFFIGTKQTNHENKIEKYKQQIHRAQRNINLTLNK